MGETNESSFISGLKLALKSVVEYDTPKIVHIKSKKIGFINRIIQICIIAYIGVYVLFWKKGYQDTDVAVSSVVSKLKGVTYTNFSILNSSDLNHRVFDVADYVIPPQENDAFFVMTNLIYTSHQVQGKCDEDPSMHDVACQKDADCPAGEPVVNGNGVRTGKCIPSTRTEKTKVCEIYSWCPVEIDEIPMANQAVLADSKHFTVLIKNHIQFVKFGVKRRNIRDDQNSTYLNSCHYDAAHEDDRYCPVFRLSSIVNNETAGQDYDSMALLGGIMAINVNWDCNFDYNVNWCQPSYSFLRLDSNDDQIAKGWNFRFAHNYYENGTQYRDLIKAYGIRFVIKVTGQAGKFSVIPLLLNVGSGLGLLALSTVVCDIIVMYVLKKGKFYQTKKYLYVQTPDSPQPLNGSHLSADGNETDMNDDACLLSNTST